VNVWDVRIIIIYMMSIVFTVVRDVWIVKMIKNAINVEYHIIWTNKWGALDVYKIVISVPLLIHARSVILDFILIQVQNNVLNAQKNVRPVLNIHFLIALNVLVQE
jgi:hypothetical protein